MTTMFSLAGKTALATATGAGIGRASALAMAEAGARVFATDVDEAALDRLRAAHAGIAPFRLDVTSDAEVVAAARRTGGVDVLLNCAGYVHQGSLLDCPPQAWDFSFDLNVKAAYRMLRAYLPLMLERGGGSIVNVSSVAAIKGVAARCAYSASKAALVGLTKSVAADYVTRGIRCNAICPGTVESPSLEERMRAQGDYDKARQAFVARQPMGRLGKPEEIAALVVYLASDDAAYTTGQLHVVDGGWTA